MTVMTEEKKNNDTTIFIEVVNLYGVKAAYGANMRLTIDRPLVDFGGVFGVFARVYTERELDAIWKQVVKGEWHFDRRHAMVSSICNMYGIE